MARTKVFAKADPLGEVVRSFAVNEEINQLLIERLDPGAWQTRISGGRTRTIAAIFVHMHHVRRKWIRLSAPHLRLPAELDRNCTRAQARKALKASGAGCMKMIEQLLTAPPEPSSSLKLSSSQMEQKFLRDGWARRWPAGPMMVAYMISHEAHHRGQVCMLSHQLGFRLPGAATSAMWGWERMGK
jgi:uncharacterized damage-inducible protein DinB